MHENREISSTLWSDDQGRSAKAKTRTADMYVPEKSDCVVVPVNQPNKGGQPSAEVGEGRAQAKGNILQSQLGHEKRLAAYGVNYADDLVICCRGRSPASSRAPYQGTRALSSANSTDQTYNPESRISLPAVYKPASSFHSPLASA